MLKRILSLRTSLQMLGLCVTPTLTEDTKQLIALQQDPAKELL